MDFAGLIRGAKSVEYRSCFVPSVGAGGIPTFTVDNALGLMLVGAQYQLATSAAVANRFKGIAVVPSGLPQTVWSSNFAQVANTSVVIGFGYALNLSSPGSGIEQACIAPIPFPNVGTIAPSVGNLDNADVISNFMAWFLVWV